MAERDRYGWDRGRDFGEREREYGHGNDREGGYQDRGAMSRGADEVRSWFGDDEARRRREIDEERDRQSGQRDRDYGANSERARREHGWGGERQHPDSPWEYGRSQQTSFGDQRDFVGRGDDWSGTQYSPRGREWNDPGYRRSGGSRDYGDEDTNRRYGNWQYSGGFGAGQSGRSYSGASSGYEGDYRSTYSNSSGGYRAGSEGSFRPGSSGWDYSRNAESRFTGYGRDSMTGEGRWSGSFAGRGPRSYQRSDERIREDVNERLTADPRIDASEIEVRVVNGEVTLSGTVDERHTRRHAEECIEDLPGVRDVKNELRVDKHRGNEHHNVGEQSRGREDGSLGHTGDPQKRDDVTTINAKDAGKR